MALQDDDLLPMPKEEEVKDEIKCDSDDEQSDCCIGPMASDLLDRYGMVPKVETLAGPGGVLLTQDAPPFYCTGPMAGLKHEQQVLADALSWSYLATSAADSMPFWVPGFGAEEFDDLASELLSQQMVSPQAFEDEFNQMACYY